MKKLFWTLPLFSCVTAYGGVISSLPAGAPTVHASYVTVGEQTKDTEGGGYLTSHDAFATYIGQVFTASPGLASTLEVNMSPPGCASLPCDGVDFKVLIAELNNGLPTNVIAETPLYTFGPSLGIFGLPVDNIAGPYPWGSLQKINLGNIDLVDGAQYAFILDFVAGADGLAGLTTVTGFSLSESSVKDPALVAQFDLETQALDQPWSVVNAYPLMFNMTFADGGVTTPNLQIVRTLPTTPVVSVPEPGTTLLMIAVGIGLAATRGCRKLLITASVGS